MLALCKSALAVVILLAAGRYLLRPLFHEIAAARSPELFTLTVLLVSLLAAWLTHALGLSLALGAFLAGMMLSETEYRHQIESDIRPFRDVLLGLFFVMVGMQLNLVLLPSSWLWIVLLVVGLVLGKGLLILGLTWLAGHGPITAVRTGIVLGHGGEFGFALLALALQTGLLYSEESQPILAAVVISMLIAPMLVRHSGQIVQKIWPEKRVLESAQAEGIAAATQAAKGHVIICGFGRVGRNMAGFLRDEDLSYVGLDLDPIRVKAAWDDGDAVYYGDAGRHDILLAAGLERAKALVISFDDAYKTLQILQAARPMRKDIPILVRSRDDANLSQFLRAGATEVVPETLEASLMLATQLLLLLDVPAEKIADCTRAVRRNRYVLLDEKVH
jgi:CPA2 family monovalent cation:H+ antiporter-2